MTIDKSVGLVVRGRNGCPRDKGNCLLFAIRLSCSVCVLPSLAKLSCEANVATSLSRYFTWMTCSEGSALKPRMSLGL